MASARFTTQTAGHNLPQACHRLLVALLPQKNALLIEDVIHPHAYIYIFHIFMSSLYEYKYTCAYLFGMHRWWRPTIASTVVGCVRPQDKANP